MTRCARCAQPQQRLSLAPCTTLLNSPPLTASPPETKSSWVAIDVVCNVFDEDYIVKLRNPHFAVPGAGRQAMLTLSARY